MRGASLLKSRFWTGGAERYLLLTPDVLSHQVVFDRKTRQKIHVRIRDAIDYFTLVQIYLTEDYRLQRLKRAQDISQLYESVLQSGKTPLIVDCGANIGLASQYFAAQFELAKVIAVEPDESNIAQARLNVGTDRVELLHCAIGSEAGHGTVVDPGLGFWGFRVSRDSGGGMPIVSVNDLLRGAGENCVPFIIKIDIEGFETDLFSKNTEWIERFPLIIIELHDWMLPRQNNAGNFLKAVAPLDRDFVFHGENVFSISNTLL